MSWRCRDPRSGLRMPTLGFACLMILCWPAQKKYESLSHPYEETLTSTCQITAHESQQIGKFYGLIENTIDRPRFDLEVFI
jgi:hypothetical protein